MHPSLYIGNVQTQTRHYDWAQAARAQGKRVCVWGKLFTTNRSSKFDLKIRLRIKYFWNSLYYIDYLNVSPVNNGIFLHFRIKFQV